MLSENICDPYASHGLGKRLVRHTLHSLYAMLPGRAYDAIYQTLCRVYHSRWRKPYGKKIAQLVNQGDQGALRRIQRVCNVMAYFWVGASGLEHTDEHASQLIDSGVPGAFVKCGLQVELTPDGQGGVSFTKLNHSDKSLAA